MAAKGSHAQLKRDGEIERCRAECHWGRLPALAEPLRSWAGSPRKGGGGGGAPDAGECGRAGSRGSRLSGAGLGECCPGGLPPLSGEGEPLS